MTKIPFLVVAGLALCLADAASAQTAMPTAPAPMGKSAAPGKAAGKPRTAQSIACSGKADQQGLHGQPRKTFMRSCKAGKA